MKIKLTPLEARTNRRYAKCQERGGCVPSGVYVVRPFPNGDRLLSVCRRCDVPMSGESWKLVLRSKARQRGADARRRAA